MFKIFKNNDSKIIIGTILIIVGIWTYISKYTHGNVFPITSTFILALQEKMAEISESVYSYIPKYKSKDTVQNEIDSLKREIRSLRNLTVDYYNLKLENEKYEKYLDLKKKNESLKFISAMVISRDPLELFYEFTINQGTENGVSINDPVITENGLIGKISHVTSQTSKVKTILSPDIKIGVTDIISNDKGILSGNINMCDENLTTMNLIQIQNSINPEDIIVTTGLSGIYPKNLQVGKVKSIEYDGENNFKYAIIEPYENIKELADVFIITNFDGKGKLNLED